MASFKGLNEFPGFSLFVPGGRLFGIASPHDLRHHVLLETWLNDPRETVSPLRALESGHLEFTPGQWWMHPIFAFHDGITDNPDTQGSICADEDGVYAITLTGSDEIQSTEDTLTYRCRAGDQGCPRLLNGILPPKQSIRILRSHTLHSPWSPSAGVRYDGLYKISGYLVLNVKEELMIHVKLVREPNQASMAEVLKHPTIDEANDYVEYRRLMNRNFQDESPSAYTLIF